MALTEEEKKKALAQFSQNQTAVASSKKNSSTSKPKTETKPKTENKPKTETKPKTESKPKTETKPKTESKPKSSANNASGKAQQFSNVIDKTPTVSAKAVSSEAEKKPMSATQYGKTQLSNQIYDKYRAAEEYYNDPTGNSLGKGLFNTLRSGVGKGIEEISKYVIDQSKNAVQGYTPGDEIDVNNRYAAKTAKIIENGQKLGFYDNAQKVVDNNYAGAIADVADQQIANAMENADTQFGKDLISAGQSMANMASYMAVGGPFMSALMGAASGAEKYNDLREQGMDYEEASVRGGAEAAITAGVGMMGGIGSPMKSVIEETAAKNILTNVAVQAMSEGGEELLEYTLGYFADIMADKIYKGEIQTDFDLSEALHAAYIGALSGGAFGAAGSVANGNIRSDSINNIAKDIVTEVKSEIDSAKNKLKKKPTDVKTDTPAEQPVSLAEAPIAEAENVTPKTANEQEGTFANAGERVEAENENEVAEAPEKTLETLKEQFDKGEISKEEYLAKNYENLSKYFEERKNANAQVNSTNDAIEPANDVVEPTNAQPRAQKNIPQEMVTPKNRVTVDPESEMEYISEEDYDGAQTNGNFGKNTVGSAQLNNTFYKSLDEFGAQRLRKEQIANGNEMRVPKKISENEAITENVGYMLGSKLADNDYMDDVIQHPEKYAHIINTDANSMQDAIDYIQNNGLDETYGAWRKTIDGHKMVEKDDISKAYLLGLFYQDKAKNETDPAKKEAYRHRALDIKRDINYAASKGGQLMQGIQMLQKAVGLDSINLKEDGEYMARGLVEKLNEDRKGKGKEIVLNEKLLKKAIDAAGTDAEGKAWDEVYKDLANQTSTSFWQRVNNYRYWCMLSNPRTHVRNIMSNVSMAIVNAVKDATKAPVEGIFNAYAKNRSNKAVELDNKVKQLIADQKKTGAKDNSAKIEKLKKRAERLHGFDNARKKTVAFYSPKDYKFAIKDFKTAKLAFDDSTGKYQENANSFVKEHKTNENAIFTDRLAKKIEGNTKAGKAVKTILEHGVFGSVMDFNSWLLTDVEDGSFKAITYAHELAQRMSANGITPEMATDPQNKKKMDELRADAFAEALYNTFNEKSEAADALRKFGETGALQHVFVESLLPFKKVPMNIIKTGRDYSPIGVAKGIGEMAKVLRDPKAGDPAKAINDIAKGLTGLELMAAGMFLRSIGKITNGLSDDENEKSYQKLLGEQAFALKFADGSSYTIDWLGAPVMPLFAGALIQDIKDGTLKEKIDFKKDDGSFDFEEAASVFGGGAVGVLSSIANPMIEMSMLQNIEYTLTSQYDSLGDFAIDAFGNYANQFVPQVLAAVAKVKDNTKRNAYYVDKTDKMADEFQVPVQVAMSKIPGVSEKLPEKVDAWGRTQTHSDRDTRLGWAFDAFISPGTYKKDKTTEADKFLLSAFDGDASVMPKMQQKYFNIEKQRKDLSAQEYVDLQKEYGKQAQKLINQLIPNKATFNKLPDELQYKVIDDVYSFASQKGKEKVTADEARKFVADSWIEDAERYAKEDGKSITQTIMERKVMGQFKTKEEQMAALQKTFGLSGDELHESYYKSDGKWNNSIDDVVKGGTNRQAKIDVFKKRKWSDEDIIAGYNGLLGYGGDKKAEQIAILTEVFGSKAKATEFYNIKEGNKGYK